MNTSGLEHFVQEISSLIRARYSLLCVHTYEEQRFLDLIQSLNQKRSSTTFVWSRTRGVLKDGQGFNDIKDPMGVLAWYETLTERSILVLTDYHPYLKEPALVRKLREMAQAMKRTPKNIVFLSPNFLVPPELAKEVTVLEMPLPTRVEIRGIVEKAAKAVAGGPEQAVAKIDSLIDAAMGLTFDEIENVLAKSLVSKGNIDPILVQDEKKQTVKKSGLLEFLDTQSGDLAEIGGLEDLKSWLRSRKNGFSREARDLNLPLPKGILLVGVPGCGKSLTAFTVGKQWELPLLRLDMGRVFSGIVGSSESNVRAALATCEAVSPCILWIDEIEKGLSGSQSSGSSDGGTTSRVFGTLLTWMQEKKSSVFVVATANDISQLPPELLRKGRFDEIFFVDLPTPRERKAIFEIQMRRYGWVPSDLILEDAISATEGFSGAEIEQVLVAARYLAFGNSQDFRQEHLVQAITETVPLSQTMRDKISAMRSWAKHRARTASSLSDVAGELSADRFVMTARSSDFSQPSAEGALR